MPGPGTYWWGTHCSFLMGRRGYRLPAGKDQYVPAPRVVLLITRGPLSRGWYSPYPTPPPVTGPDLRRGVTLSNDQDLWFNEAPHIAPPRWIEATGSGYPPGTDPTVFRPATRRTTRPVHAWKVILKSSGSGTARPAPDPAEQSARIRSAENGRLRHALRDGYLAL